MENFTQIMNATKLPTLLLCRGVYDVNVSERCSYVQTTGDCRSGIGYVDYSNYMFCAFGPENVIPAVSLSILWLLTLFLGLGVTSNDFLCPALFVISKSLKMSQNVAGVTLLAFGNGSPDIFSAIAGIKQKKNELVISGLLGGGIFVTTVVAGSIFLTQSFTLMKRPFLRDVAFYIGAVSWVFYLFYTGSVYLSHAIGLICLYVFYIIVVVVSRIIRQKQMQAVPANPKEKEATQEKGDLAIAFPKSKCDLDNPEHYGVVLKAFFFLNEDFLGIPSSRNPPPSRKTSRQSFSGQVNPGFILPIGDNICVTADNTIVTIDNFTKDKSLKKETIIEEEEIEEFIEVGELYEFIQRMSPINFQNWQTYVWWQKILEVVKAPILFLLSLTAPVVDLNAHKQYWCRLLNCMHCITGPLFITLIIAGPDSHIHEKIPTIPIVFLGGLILAAIVYFTSEKNAAPKYHWGFAYLGFLVAVVWIYCIANEIVVLLQAIGVVFNLSDSIIGLTILAWGNCLLDFLSNLAVARKGYPRMGIAACFGSPFLTLLLGIGVPSLIELASGATDKLTLVYSPLATVLFVTIATSLLATLTTMTALHFSVKKPYGVFLLCLYAAFLLTAILIESGFV